MIVRAAQYISPGMFLERDLVQRLCRSCGKPFVTVARNAKRCPECRPAHEARIDAKASAKQTAKERPRVQARKGTEKYEANSSVDTTLDRVRSIG